VKGKGRIRDWKGKEKEEVGRVRGKRKEGMGRGNGGKEGKEKEDLHPTQFFGADYSGLPSYGSPCIIYNLPT